jgi:O-antigen/teichoic acid export membrane protein
MKNRVTFFNVITNVLAQICLIISGFIIPKLILSCFGSNVNGLVSSVNQFLSYITLVEGGVASVITASLYGPLSKKDYQKLSSIVKTSQHFYYSVGIIYVIYSMVLAILYPVLFTSEFSFGYIFSLVLVLSIGLLIQYMFSLTAKLMLTADKKSYIVSLTQIIITVINVVIVVICIKVFPNIHVLKLLCGLLYLIQPLVYSRYIRTHYNLEKKSKVNNELLKNRWNGFAINIAYFIHVSTDITILTIFTDLKTVSIYSIYALVTNGIKAIISAISSGVSPTIGHALASGNENELINKFNICEYLFFLIVFSFFTIAGLLINPFVMTYTRGITDANYYQPIFGIILLLSEALYLIKSPHVTLAYASNKFKELIIPCYLEAGLNIVISIILVSRYGLIGVAIGTTIAMLYRLIFHVHYTKKIISKYNPMQFYIKSLTFGLAMILIIALSLNFFSQVQHNYISLIIRGLCYTGICVLFFGMLSLLLYKKESQYILRYLLGRTKKDNKG